MKHAKRLKLKNKKLLEKIGLISSDWLQVKDTIENLHIVHRVTGEVRIILKEGHKR